jgi:hypothetical protein
MQFYWAFIFMTFVLFIIAVLTSDTIRDVSIILGLLNILLSLYMKQISLREHSELKNDNKTNKSENKTNIPQIFTDEIDSDIQIEPFLRLGDGVQNSTIEKNLSLKNTKIDVKNELPNKHLQRYKYVQDRNAKKIIGSREMEERQHEKPQPSSRYAANVEANNYSNTVSPFSNNTSRMDDKTIHQLGGTAATLNMRKLRRGKSGIEEDKLKYDKWRNKYNKDYNMQRRSYEPGALNKFFEPELHENERLAWWGYY